MDWTANLRIPVVPQLADNSLSFLYNYPYDHFPGSEMKQHQQTTQNSTFPALMNNIVMYGQDSKKKRMSTEQMESLENNFQEDIKLEPERKMKLAKELGLQPRQIAVWFQNRRARWKGKQLERLYDALKQDFKAVSREKHKLQQEVIALRAIVKDQMGNIGNMNELHQIGECSNVMSEEDYNAGMMTPYNWAA